VTRFDPLRVPLVGTHLVEAGAGTGKTYGLTALYLRQIVEAKRRPREIAVVTFTEAATRELRSRVRERLVLLAQRLTGGPDSGDAVVESLALELAKEPGAHNRIRSAAIELDDATIATIHGFCRRVLSEFALDASQPFATLEPDDGLRWRARALRDFWRRAVVAGDPDEAEWVLSWLPSADALGEWINEALRLRAEHVVPVVGEAELAALRARVDAARAAAPRKALPRVLHDLATTTALSRSQASPYRSERIEAQGAALGAWLDGAGTAPPLEGLQILTRACIARHRNKSRGQAWTLPPEEILDWAAKALDDALRYAYARRSAFLRRALGDVRAGIAAQKREQRVVSFDDLVADLRDVVAASPDVVRAVRERYRVALVDEFQDTDADQYAIFRALFHGRSDGALYLIGDPKQAIYRFRGGDVFAYRAAARDAGRNLWTLDDNWRSDARLIEAVNALFDERRVPQAFVHDFIAFRPAGFGGPRKRVPSMPVVDAPLVVFTPDEAFETNDRFARVLHDAVAAEVGKLLAEHPGAATPSIAVLVRDRYEVAGAIGALARRGIVASYSSSDSVYGEREAAELATVLEALADPADLRRARAALATELAGFDDAALRAMKTDALAFDAALALLARWRETALAHGPAALARTLAQRVGARWLSHHDGRRRMTNLAHVGEALQREARALPGLAAQAAWLVRRIASGLPSEDAELRPEPGASSVVVLTIHKSKGLEWDIVFAPFLWRAKKDEFEQDPVALPKRRPVGFHDRDEGGLRVDLGGDDWDRHAEERQIETAAENVRLAYVALTRARHRVYTCWAAARGADVSALAHLLHPGGLAAIDREGIARQLEAWRAHARGAVEILALPIASPHDVAEVVQFADDMPALAARTFRGAIDRRFRVLSYSSLFGESDDARPDHDETAPSIPYLGPGPVPSSPRGAKFGECVHAILEDYAFDEDAIDNDVRVEKRCREFGYDADETAIVRELVRDTIRAEVVPGVPLASLGTRHVELEFFFPLDDTRLGDVADALALEPRYARSDAEFAALRPRWSGLMHGYVDLVFAHDGRYGLIDYKTNFLGSRYEDYAASPLAKTVRASDYDLQYLIYSVALVRQLRARLGARFDYDRDYAGVAYLFVRGLAGGHGVHRDVPPFAVIEALDRAFGGRR